MARQILADLDFNSAARIRNLLSPANSDEPATKAYVDAGIEGLAWKDSARVATQADTNLASPGSTIDGITMANGDRVLVKAQTDDEDNGIYIWNGASTPMTRAPDASTAAELEQAVLTVEEGTDADTTWRQTSINFTLDTDPVAFVAFGTAVPDASESVKGKIEIADQTETDAGTDDEKAITPDKLANWSGRKRKATGTIGDGSATSYTITHNFGTKAVDVRLYRNSGNYDEVEAEVRHNNNNSVDILFAAAPTSNQFAYVILG